MKIEISRLNLLRPLYYFPEDEALPFSYSEGSGEKLFCFELDETEHLNIEPDREKLLGKLLFKGKAAGEEKTPLELPCGNYLFAQEREILNREDILTAVIEIQKEGLWQRLQPGKNLYLRYLFEDGRGVTQVFRPYKRKVSTM